MALKPPGSASKFGLLMSSIWTIIMLLCLIGGHLVLLIFFFLHFDQQAGMEVLVEKTGLPNALLWTSVGIALLMDVWIFLSGKKAEEHARRR